MYTKINQYYVVFLCLLNTVPVTKEHKEKTPGTREDGIS